MVNVYHQEASGLDASEQHVFLAIPVMGGFPAKVAATLWDYRGMFEKAGIACDLCILSGNCHVDDSRNYLVRQFLNTKADTFIFIDADVAARGSDLVRLAKHDRDVVAGLYPYKSDETGFPALFGDGEVNPEPDGLIPVDHVPTGFLKIRRHVLETLARDAPKFYGKQENRSVTHPIPRIFARTHIPWEGRDNVDPDPDKEWHECGVYGDQYGGDYWFCKLWLAKGGKIYADPNFMLSHIGEKEWAGCIGHWLRKTNGLLPVEFNEMTQRLLGGQTTMDIWERWRNSYFNADWAPSTDFVEAAYLLARDPGGPILECGSGLTTLALAMGAKISGRKIYALEHDEGFYAVTLELLENYGLADHVILRHAPLQDYGAYDWYAEPLWKPQEGFSTVILDGPPRTTKGGRKGFYEIYGGHLAGRCRIMVDDMADQAVGQEAIDRCRDLGFDTAMFRAGKPFMIAKRNDVDAEARRVA
jgi:hypothetical protein